MLGEPTAHTRLEALSHLLVTARQAALVRTELRREGGEQGGRVSYCHSRSLRLTNTQMFSTIGEVQMPTAWRL